MLEWNAQQLELSNLEGGPTMPKEITLNPGAPSEQTIEPGAIQVPDLWHIAQYLKKTGEKVYVLVDGEMKHVLAGDYILEAWHLAHALKRYIQDHPAEA